MDEWLETLNATLSSHPDDADARYDLEQICKLVIREMNGWKVRSAANVRSYSAEPAPFSDSALAQVLITTVTLDIKSMFLQAYELCASKKNLEIFLSIGVAFLRYDLKDRLPQYVQPSSPLAHTS